MDFAPEGDETVSEEEEEEEEDLAEEKDEAPPKRQSDRSPSKSPDFGRTPKGEKRPSVSNEDADGENLDAEDLEEEEAQEEGEEEDLEEDPEDETSDGGTVGSSDADGGALKAHAAALQQKPHTHVPPRFCRTRRPATDHRTA